MANKFVLFTVMSVGLAIIFAASIDGRHILQPEDPNQLGEVDGAETSFDRGKEIVGQEKAAVKPAAQLHNVPRECFQPDGTLYCCYDAPEACIYEEGFCNYNDSPCAGR